MVQDSEGAVLGLLCWKIVPHRDAVVHQCVLESPALFNESLQTVPDVRRLLCRVFLSRPLLLQFKHNCSSPDKISFFFFCVLIRIMINPQRKASRALDVGPGYCA